MRPPNILLLGGSGQVGRELSRSLRTLGEVHRPPSADVNLTDAARLREVVRSVEPSVIVNAAAHTSVDRAEGDDQECSRAINAIAPGILAEEAARVSATLVHFSTDYVFDGAKGAPYREEDPPSPLNAYGRHKLAGEQAVLASDADALVFRIGWVYDLSSRNFLTTVRRLAAENDAVSIVDDQVGVPTWSGAVAAAVASVLAMRARASEAARRADRGVYHMAGAGGVSWAGFAEAILRSLPVPGREHVRVLPIPTTEFPTPARRPAYSVMNSDKLRRRFGVFLPRWEEQLALAIRQQPALPLP